MAIARLKLDDQFSGPAQSAAAATTKLRDEFGKFSKVGVTSSGQLVDAFGKVARGAKTIPSAVKPATGSLEDLSGQFGSMLADIDPVTLAIKAAEVEIAALATVVVGAVVGLGSLMMSAIETTQSMDRLRNTMQALTGDGSGTTAMISKLVGELPQAKSQINEWATALAASGMKGKELETSIRAVASAQALMGDAGAGAAQNLLTKFNEMADAGGKIAINSRVLKQLGAAGVSAKMLADELGVSPGKLDKMKVSAEEMERAFNGALIKNGKDSLVALGMTWESISGKLSAGFQSLFADPAIAKGVHEFMQAVKQLFSSFFAGTPAMKGAGSIVTSILVPAFKAATAVVKATHVAISTLVNWFLKAAIAFNRFRQTAVGAAVIKGVLIAIVATAVVVGAVIGAAALAFGMLAAAMLAVPAAMAFVVGALFAGVAALAALASYAWDAASSMVQGLVNGISAGTGAVVAAMRNLAMSGLNALKSTLGISSPSKVMMQMGSFTGQGMVQGLKGQAPNVAAAGQQMAGSAAGGAASGGGKGGGKGLSITLAAGAIQINGAGSSGEALTLTESAIALLFERLALQRGLVTP